MANENAASVNTKLSQENVCIISRLESEITRIRSLEETNVKDATRFAVYQIILKAIALSKTPGNEVCVKEMYSLAESIVIQADLDSDQDIEVRLQDLINAIIDSSDLGSQFRLYRLSNERLLEVQRDFIKSNFDLIKQDNLETKTTLNNVNRNLDRLRDKKNIPKLISYILLGITLISFTIILSVVIITTVLKSDSNSVSTEESRKNMLLHPENVK